MADVTSPFGFPYPEPTDLVRDGATDIEALAEAANDQFLAGFQFAGQRIYTSSGTFVKADPLGTGDIGLRAVRVTCVGGGAAGGGAAATSPVGGGGGGGGGFAQSLITDIAGLDSSVTVTRGAGGSGANAAAGNSGANSSFGSAVIGNGGNGGATGAIASGGAGGAGTGEVVFNGGLGLFAANFSNFYVGGAGGGSSVSSAIGGPNLRTFGGSAGNQATGTGAGGGGAANRAGSTSQTGGAGANGIVIVEVFV